MIQAARKPMSHALTEFSGLRPKFGFKDLDLRKEYWQLNKQYINYNEQNNLSEQKPLKVKAGSHLQRSKLKSQMFYSDKTCNDHYETHLEVRRNLLNHFNKVNLAKPQK